jgi:poly(hydroxyalkanoate) granule-associated protein
MTDDDQHRSGGQDWEEFARTLKGSARQVWLAGLGAFARAQQEGGKLFETLAREGASLQDRFDPQAREPFGPARSTVAGLAANASQRLEQIFDERVSKSLDRLDVPLASDVDALTARVEALERALAALGPVKPAPRRRAGAAKDAGAAAPVSSPPDPE